MQLYISGLVIVVLVVSALIGLWRGLLRGLLGLLAFALAIVCAYYFGPYVNDYLIENTSIDEKIESKVYSKIEETLLEEMTTSLSEAGITENLEKTAREETDKLLEEVPDNATQVQLIEELDLGDSFEISDSIKTELINNNNEETYAELGISTFYKYISNYIARMSTKAVAFAITFVASYIVLAIIAFLLGKIVAMIPIVKGFDRFCGMLLGIAIGYGIICVGLFAASLVFPTTYEAFVGKNQILTFFDAHNLLYPILEKVMSK